VRALASESLEPDDIARRFDALYRDANSAPESFISLFVGIHDRRDDSLTYTNAGHEACWVRHGRDVTMLAPTGPIIGLGELPFTRDRRTLVPGELLFLATDGLTEARQPDGTFVTSEQLRTWVVEADASDPQRFVDTMLGFVTRWSRGRIVDDLALLAVMPFRERETPVS
jgi:phosphoserine phosphatase RsbU/P